MDPTLAIDIRPVTIALFAGVVVAFAQIAPSLEAPVFFRVVQGWGLARSDHRHRTVRDRVAGGRPVAGVLLRRYRPRTLVAGGMLALGLGDMAFALVSPSTPYLYFIVPFMAIGAGFVIATTVRTAIIFASVPRRLPEHRRGAQPDLAAGGQPARRGGGHDPRRVVRDQPDAGPTGVRPGGRPGADPGRVRRLSAGRWHIHVRCRGG